MRGRRERRGPRAGGRDGSRAGGDGTGGRDGSVDGGGAASPDDRRSIAVQLQLSSDGGRRRPRLRDAAAASRRNDRRSAALCHRRNAASRPSGGRRRRPDGPKVVNGGISRARTPRSRHGPSRITQGEETTSLAASALLLDDLGPQLRRGLLDAQPQIVGVDGVHCRRRGRRSTRVPGVARRI